MHVSVRTSTVIPGLIVDWINKYYRDSCLVPFDAFVQDFRSGSSNIQSFLTRLLMDSAEDFNERKNEELSDLLERCMKRRDGEGSFSQ